MLLRYFYDDKIAHASYLVGCQACGEAAVIDPARDIESYLQVAQENDLRIVAAAETHIHADFLSGSREVAERTGAKLYLSDEGDQNWKYEFVDDYKHQLVKDGHTFKIGNIKFEVLHTPGHTPEHIAFLVTDTAGANLPIGIFSGDFVFVGDVGRPDLLEEAAGIKGTAEPGARQMFHSLKRFKTLPDYIQVWPAHGAGSACGKALGAVPSSTVGYEKLFNWALAYEDEGQFVQALLAGQPEAPFYFAMMKQLNKVKRSILKDGLPQPVKLDAACLKQVLEQGAIVVDTRSPKEFGAAHIPGTLNIPLDKSFTNWAGWLVGYEQPFYVIASKASMGQIVHDLIYIGLDHLGGYFEPEVIATWPGERQSYQTTTPGEIAETVLKGEVTVIDVRALSEWNEGHLPQARHIMLGYLLRQAAEIPRDKPVLVHCQVHSRSAIGASILQAKGISQIIKLDSGYEGWVAAGLPVEYNGK